MSFSMLAKEEILNVKRNTDALFCMLCGEILSAGSLVVSRNKLSFVLTSESVEFLKHAKQQLISCFQLKEDSIKINENVGHQKTKHELKLSAEDGYRVLEELNIVYKTKNGELEVSKTISPNLVYDEDCKKAYLAGAFCGAGTISVPSEKNEQTKGYHMEWVASNPEKAETISEYLAEFGIISRRVLRGEAVVVYIKESDAISRTLVILGATKNMLSLENRKITRQVRNNINRQSNCLSANLDKVMSASAKQIRAINIIDQTIGLGSLSDSLKEIAALRKKYPEASLSELAEVMHGKITRAGISDRLNKLVKLSSTLGEENE